MKDKTTIYLGPPGTGKTTRELNVVEQLIEEGTPAKSIAYLAFTRKAAAEARERAMARFLLTDDDLPWFRTIHSLAFRQSGAKADRLLKKQHYREIADRCGFLYQGEEPEQELEVFMNGPGDAMLFMENLARVTERPLADVYEDKAIEKMDVRGADNYLLEDVEELRRQLRVFKSQHGLLDYTDALEDFVQRGFPPNVKVLIVDEAQDLSSLQWKAVTKVAAVAERVIVAGDDDQAIFRWAGADVERFLTLEGKVEVLDQSYRIPADVHSIAHSILRGIKRRRPKIFAPRPVRGDVRMIHDDDEIDADSGKWLFLARHGYQLKQLEDLCKSKGWFYDLKGEWSNQSLRARAILAWESLRSGAPAKAEDVVLAIANSRFDLCNLLTVHPENLLTKADVPWAEFDQPWTEALSLMFEDDAEYFIQARRGGEKMAARDENGTFRPVEPRIKISTIHGAKGGEADGVYLSTDVSESTRASMDRDGDDEHRVFYVGVTRTKEKLRLKIGDVNAFQIEEE